MIKLAATAPLAAFCAAGQPPYSPSPVIRAITFGWSTHRPTAQGIDNWRLTWADDDRQYGVWSDGGGFGTVV
jgi:hypothetical protein